MNDQGGNWMVGAGASILAIAVVAGTITMEGCPKDDTQPPPTQPPVKIEPERQQLLELHQSTQIEHNRKPSLANAKLMRAAQKHAEWMAANRRLSHTGKNGSTVGQRIAAEGYKSRGWGENISAGYASNEAAMKGWMNSSGHRANILSGKKHIGIGYAVSANNKIYRCAVFANPHPDEKEPEPDPLPPAEMFEPPFDDVEVPDLPTDPDEIRKLLERARKAREQLEKLKDAGAKFVLPDGTEVELDGNQGRDTHP